MRLLPIASGKGGVGKSLVAANLALALTDLGHKVVLVDLDLGGSNLHTILGMRGLAEGIGTFLAGRSNDFSRLLYPTEYHNLSFIPGDSEIPGMANVTAGQKRKLLRRIQTLEADYVVLDLGSGSSYNTVDFFLASARGIVVTTPGLTAILNAYLFLKNCVFRLVLRSFGRSSPAAPRIAELQKNPQSMQRLYVPALLDELKILDPSGYESFVSLSRSFRPSLIMNLLEDPRDGQKAGKIRRSCKQYLGIEVEHLGVVYRDVLQDTALASGLPIIIYKPDTVLSKAIVRIADKISEIEWEDTGEAVFDDIDDSYRMADTEADTDFDAKIESMHDLLSSGVLSQGDLVETIRSQQYENNRLKTENTFLKSKVLKAAEMGFDVL